MLLTLLFESPLLFVLAAGGLIIALTIHEFAHAFIADKLGDPTPTYQGRVTLNPLAHLDPLGTLAILVVGFGWGKPVQFDPFNLKDPKRDTALIALAGPASNILLAIALAVVYHLLPGTTFFLGIVAPVLQYIISINVMLAIFNLVPVYPLDGSKIFQALLPAENALAYEQFMQRYGSIVLLMLIVPWSGSSPVQALISPIISFVVNLLV
ncbi:MAG: site-2 protease family protein [Candidatus Pacebacteria bacterium]|nr:site-2 protease family protein [Candidatus Paceibacterota bacterium]PIR63296.1 MAG: site-2 protease family protein [Candidatus Pacebacteria bacterium CG10_big_fil_rev_8_21_14_0_10_40_26]PIZ79177.1 MAG: site-2 protease family protein [Candidatus Pacebacteria bacterium CG_4_10_14_0_2_um_filter_40_20]PJA68832.1 MAG: site-2 protease family protein [Candidatus Pacebacteria bacterium CG_4_9_14_3_um_filter_40_12]PJC42143.1 MAG: site-2 protease family protein [Candidatus Pacebacteria bacterium CG_4_